MNDLDLSGRVAIVTGGGGGLGREYALALASRNARVVVNDLGSSVDGTGSDPSAAIHVASEIQVLGGIAIADGHSVAKQATAERIVDVALQAFGRLDIVVNNAGIVREDSFHNMATKSFDDVVVVHLRGAFNVIRAAWPHMREQNYGRVVNTSSGAGVFGLSGQANYSAAKAGIIGLTKTLAIEGVKCGIAANAIAPVARTRMTEAIMSSYLAERATPNMVSPLVVWLSSDKCVDSGSLYTVGAGRVARIAVAMTHGWTRTDGRLTPEDIRDHWAEINDFDGVTFPNELNDDFRALVRSLAGV